MKNKQYKPGTIVSTIMVNAVKGFNIHGKHKFNAKVFQLENGRLVVKYEYCRPCSKAKSTLRIKGEEQDYVQMALNSQPIAYVEDFLPRKLIFDKNFRQLVIDSYKKLEKQK